MKRIEGFNGLRALSVSAVFFGHMRTLQISLASTAVYVFFVLSGFLITGILTDSRARVDAGKSNVGAEMATFYWRRTLRIFPIYYLALAVYGVWIFGSNGRAPHGLWSFGTYLSNIWLMTQDACEDSLLCHFWSLAIEEQFYLVLAPLLLLVPRSRHAAIVVTVFLVGIASLFSSPALGLDARQQYLSSLTNFSMLALGGLMSLAYRRGETVLRTPGLVAGIAALIVVAFVLTAHVVRAHSDLLYGLFFLVMIVSVGCSVLWVARNQTSAVVAALSWRPLAYLGAVSYGFYLYHPGCIHLYRMLVPAGWNPLVNFVLCFSLTLGVTQLSWMFIETKVARFRDLPRRSGIRSAAAREAK